MPLLLAAGTVLAVFAFVGAPADWLAVLDGPDATEPSCAWPARIEHADADQDSLIRCYLSAVALHSRSALRTVVPSGAFGGPSRLTAADFAHARDAGKGEATVVVVSDRVDSAGALVEISYADGARESREIHLADPASSHSWRFSDVGAY